MFSDARLRPWEMDRFLPAELDAIERFLDEESSKADAAERKAKG